jgi:hypothetical protein
MEQLASGTRQADGKVWFQLRPCSFLADWPVPGPISGGMLRPVSNLDVTGNMRSFWPNVELKLDRNKKPALLFYSIHGTEWNRTSYPPY